MAVTNESLLVDIQVNTEKSAKSIEDLKVQLEGLNAELKNNTKSTKQTEQAVTGFGASMVKFNAIIGVAKEVYGQLSGVINASIAEYEEAERASMKLQLTLASLGKYTEQTQKEFEDFAGELQDTTGYSDDLALSLLGSAKAMGRTDEEAKQMVATAADLAALTGKDLNEAFQGLQGTLKGQVRGLGEMGIQFKNMSKDAMESGEVIKKLNEQIGGTAKASLDSFSGSSRAAGAALADLQETLGGILVESFNLQGANQDLAETYKSLKRLLIENKDVFNAIGEAVGWLVDKIKILTAMIMSGLVGAFQQLIAVLSAIGGALAKLGSLVGLVSEEKAQSLKDFANSMNEAAGVSFAAIGEGAKELVGLTEQTKKATAAGKDFAKARDEMNKKAKERGPVAVGLTDEQLKFIEELKKKNMEMSSQIAQADMLHQDRIQEQLRLQKEILSAKLKELKLNGDNIDAVQEQLKLLDLQAKKAGEKAPSREFETAQKSFGGDAAKKIGEAMSGAIEGTAGSVLGMMSGAGAVMGAVNGVLDFVQQLIDFIPQILDKLANIFDSLTDLPLKILAGVQKLLKSIGRFVTDFVKNLLDAIPGIVESLLDFLIEGLPNALMTLIDKLPDFIMKLVDRLPEIAAKLVEAIIFYGVTMMPILAIKLIETLIAKGPEMIVKIFKTLYIEIPKAIIRGFVTAIKKLVEAIQGLFSGKKFGNEIGKSITNAMKAVQKSLTGASSKVFNVSDLQEGLASVGDPIKNAVEDVMDDLWDWLAWLKKLWQWIIDSLRKLWLWIWEKLLLPLVNALRQVWQWVYDFIVKPLLDGLMFVWNMIYNGFIKPMLDGLQAVWNFVLFNVINPLVNGVRNVFGWVNSTIFQPFLSAIQTTFGWVGDVLNGANQGFVNTFGWVNAIFSGIISGLNSVAGSLNGAFNFIKQYVVDPLKAGFGWIGDIVGGINKLFTTPGWLQGFIDAVNALGDAGGGLFSKGGPVYAAEGMLMTPRGTDTVPAMLTPGEFVVNKSAVNSLGMNAMHQINNGQLPGGGTSVNVSMNITTTQPIDEAFVRSKLMPRIRDEMRRASLDGAFIISGKGIRTT